MVRRAKMVTWVMTTAVTVLASMPAAADDRAAGSRRQEPAVSRAGMIPGLGNVSANIKWDNRQELVLQTQEFVLSRVLDPHTRETTVQVRGGGSAPVTIRLGGPDGFSVMRDGDVVRGTTDIEGIRRLLDGRAVAAARERLGAFERRLAAGPASRLDDPHAYGFLLVGALLGSLHGDPAAIGRARDLMVRRAQGAVRAVRFDFQNCVQDYQKFLLDIDTNRTNCLEAANSRDSWYFRAADRLACEMEFMANALAGEGQFVSCTALGSII
jgi:hypothetical protein